MFKQTISYVDFNGRERVEDFYFHLSLPEVARIEAMVGEGTIKDHIEQLIVNQNNKELLDFLEHIILSSYGRKTPDGRSFEKSPELRREFEYSQAYAEFFEMLITKEGLAQKFGEKVADNGQGRKNEVAPQIVSE